MRFSLLVPCYNAEKFIDGFSDNIAALDKPFDEVIFYDDASTDRTYQLLKAKGLNVIKGNHNRGPGFARNKLTEHTSCEWFHFHDIDDELKSDYLAKTSVVAQANKFDVILCNVNWYDARTRDLILTWQYSDAAISQNPVGYTISHPIGGINGLYRKSKFIETGGFDTGIRIWEDADLHVKLAAASARFCVIEEVLSYSLRYATSISADQCLGWQIRLKLLQHYALIFNEQVQRNEIGKQAQTAASNLVICRQYAAARQALQLSEQCNIQVPYSKSRIWNIIKVLLPGSARINLRLRQLKIVFNQNNRS